MPVSYESNIKSVELLTLIGYLRSIVNVKRISYQRYCFIWPIYGISIYGFTSQQGEKKMMKSFEQYLVEKCDKLRGTDQSGLLVI